MSTTQDQTEAIRAAIQRFMTSLDGGDLEGLLDCCDPQIVTANERKPTSVGREAMRDKYAPRIANFSTVSSFDTEHLSVHGDFAIAVGQFGVAATHRTSGEAKESSGRLLLVYRRHADGSWKVIVDVDNN